MNRNSKILHRTERKGKSEAPYDDKMADSKSARVAELEQLRRNTIGTLSIIERLLAEEKQSAKT